MAIMAAFFFLLFLLEFVFFISPTLYFFDGYRRKNCNQEGKEIYIQ